MLVRNKARFFGPDSLALHSAVTTGGELADYVVSFDADYAGVRYLANQSLPTLGTIDFAISVDRTRGDDVRSFEATAQLTYGGNAAPTTLVLDGVTYGFDMATGAVVRQ